MKLTMVQAPVGADIVDNKAIIVDALKNAVRDEWLAFPEGLLSGYFPERDDYRDSLDERRIGDAVGELDGLVREIGCHAVFGSAMRRPDGWANAMLSLHPDGPGPRHDKVELSRLDRRHFVPGTGTAVHRAGGVTFGMLGCREVLFPAYWAALKAAGAQVVFHLNNAIQPHDARWDALFVARALENSIFVCSVNNATPPQALPSLLVAPDGAVLVRTEVRRAQTVTTEIDPSAVIADLANRTDY